MTTTILSWPPQRVARTAGFGYLMIIVAGIFAEFIVRSGMIVPGDAAATTGNITASESLFRLGIAGDLVMLIFDVIVALALYVLLAPVSKGLALLATFFRLVHSAVVGASLLNLAIVLLLVGGTGAALAFPPAQLQELVMLFLNAHSYGYVLGLAFFAFHCVLLGYLVYKSGFFPKILGALLMLASIGYLVDSFAHVLLHDYADYAPVLMIVVFVPAFVAEMSFTIYLLTKGVKESKTGDGRREKSKGEQ